MLSLHFYFNFIRDSRIYKKLEKLRYTRPSFKAQNIYIYKKRQFDYIRRKSSSRTWMMDGDFSKKRVDPNLPWDRPAGVWRDIIYIYIYLLLSHLLCTDAHLCLQKKEKRTPSVQARKLEISPNFFYIYSVSKLRAHVPHSCVCARIHAAGKVEEWGGRRDTVAFSTLQPMQQWRLGIGGSSSAQCAADVFI